MTRPHTVLDRRVINILSSCSPENTFILWNSNSVFPREYKAPLRTFYFWECWTESQFTVKLKKCVKTISSPSDWKVKNARVFQIALERQGKMSPSGRIGNFGEGRDFFIGWWKSPKEWVWPFKLFSMLKTLFCKYWTSVKSKLVWPVWN